jgi:hypothetical protein
MFCIQLISSQRLTGVEFGCNVLLTANRYLLGVVEQYCVNYLKSAPLQDASVLSSLQVIFKYKGTVLFENVLMDVVKTYLQIIEKNANELFAPSNFSFLTLQEDILTDLLSSEYLNISEYDLYTSICAYIKHNTGAYSFIVLTFDHHLHYS